MYTVNENFISQDQLDRLLSCIDNARIGLIGDLCLDMYWLADMRYSELSRETPHYPLPIVEERFSPGGAGNVACNIAALKPALFLPVGMIGEDWRGDLLLHALKEQGIDCRYVIRTDEYITNTYIKPLRRGISDVVYEDPRMDFENREPVSATTEQLILKAIDKIAAEIDVICVSDQMRCGCITPAVREKLSELGKSGKIIIADSRSNSAAYHHVIVKPNETEAVNSFGKGTEHTLDELAALAQSIACRNQRTTLVTLGERGCFVADADTVTHCPAYSVNPPIDFCGAGDTFLAGFGTLIAGGAAPVAAAQIANLCSAVTIRKLGTTGTASREEVMLAGKRNDSGMLKM